MVFTKKKVMEVKTKGYRTCDLRNSLSGLEMKKLEQKVLLSDWENELIGDPCCCIYEFTYKYSTLPAVTVMTLP